MFYLIGGPPRCGKTTLSKMIADEFNLPLISTDTLETIVAVSTHKNQFAKKFPKAVMRLKTQNSNDIMYNRYSAQQIVNAYKIHAKTTWPAIEAMIEAEMKAGHSYILEGHQIHPKLVAKLTEKYGKKQIHSVFLVKENIEQIVEGAQQHRAKNDWFIQKTKDKKTYTKIAEMISRYGKFFLKEAKRYHLPVFSMDYGFHDQFEKIIDFIKKT